MDKVHEELALAEVEHIRREIENVRSRPREATSDEASIVRLIHFQEQALSHIANVAEATRADALHSLMVSMQDAVDSALATCYLHRSTSSIVSLRNILAEARAELAAADVVRSSEGSREVAVGLSVKNARDCASAARKKLAQLGGDSDGSKEHDARLPAAVPTRVKIEELALRLQVSYRVDPRVDGEFQPFSSAFESTRVAAALRSRDLETQDARERFSGYQRSVEKLRSRFALCAGIRFVLLPEGTYTLGANAVQTCCPVSGGHSGSAQLDRRSRAWIRHLANTNEGFPQSIGCTCGRTVTLPSMYISESVVTLTQFEALRKDRRFAVNGLHVDELFQRDNVEVARYWQGRCEGIELMHRRSTIDDSLRVPFFAAEQIASALGCHLASVDTYEAAVCGIEGAAGFVADKHSIHTYLTDWKEVCGGVTVTGHSNHIKPSDLVHLRSASGLVAAPRAEWNTTSYCADLELPDVTTHLLRSATDFDTQSTAEEELDKSAIPYVGPAASCYSAPSDMTPLAAFRLAIPADSTAKQLVETAGALERKRRGVDLGFTELLSFAIGQPLAAVLSDLAPLRYDRRSRDALFGHHVLCFFAAGFDLTFEPVDPFVFSGITLHCRSQCCDGVLSFTPQRNAFAHPVTVCGSSFRLDDANMRDWWETTRMESHDGEDHSAFVELTDAIEVPPSLHSPFPAAARLSIRLMRRGSTFYAVEISILDWHRVVQS